MTAIDLRICAFGAALMWFLIAALILGAWDEPRQILGKFELDVRLLRYWRFSFPA